MSAQWEPVTYNLWHELGLFCVFEMSGKWHAGRHRGGPGNSERLGEHATLAGAQTACAARIAQLQAESCEQLDASLPEVTL